jgi:hypothetical protein
MCRTGYGLDDRSSRVRFPAGAGNFSLHHRVQNASGAYPVSYPMGTRSSFPGVKRPGREADHSPPSNSEVKNAWSCTSAPQYVFMVWCLMKQWIHLHGVIVKHRDNFTFTLWQSAVFYNIPCGACTPVTGTRFYFQRRAFLTNPCMQLRLFNFSWFIFLWFKNVIGSVRRLGSRCEKALT